MVEGLDIVDDAAESISLPMGEIEEMLGDSTEGMVDFKKGFLEVVFQEVRNYISAIEFARSVARRARRERLQDVVQRRDHYEDQLKSTSRVVELVSNQNDVVSGMEGWGPFQESLVDLQQFVDEWRGGSA